MKAKGRPVVQVVLEFYPKLNVEKFIEQERDFFEWATATGWHGEERWHSRPRLVSVRLARYDSRKVRP